MVRVISCWARVSKGHSWQWRLWMDSCTWHMRPMGREWEERSRILCKNLWTFLEGFCLNIYEDSVRILGFTKKIEGKGAAFPPHIPMYIYVTYGGKHLARCHAIFSFYHRWLWLFHQILTLQRSVQSWINVYKYHNVRPKIGLELYRINYIAQFDIIQFVYIDL